MGLARTAFGGHPVQAFVGRFLVGVGLPLSWRRAWVVPAARTGLLGTTRMGGVSWRFCTRLYPGVLEGGWEPTVLAGTRLGGGAGG
jgi:hypothetical protein